MQPGQKPMRVSLTLGVRTDPAILKELGRHSPYARAKLLRDLMAEGWRVRTGGLRAPLQPSTITSQPLTPASGAQPPISAGVLALLGDRVRE